MKKLAIILLLILLLPVLSWADTTIYGAIGSADLNSPGPIGATTPSTGKFTGLTVAPTATGTLLDFLLETEWTTGTILNADFGSATVQSGNMFGIILDFNTNLAGVTDQDIGSFVTMTPVLTQTTSNTTNYIGYSLPTAGALVQTTNAGSIYWTGFNLQMPNITQTTGTVKSYGLYINGGTVTSGTQYAIFVDSGNVRLDGSLGDTTNRTVKGWFTDLESTNVPTVGGTSILSGAAITFGEVDGSATGNLSATNVSRTVVNSYGRSAAATLTLPAGAAGYAFTVIVGTQHNSAWKIQRAGSDTIYFNGVSGKTYFQETNQAIGSYVSCTTFKTGASAWSWLCSEGAGTWVTD